MSNVLDTRDLNKRKLELEDLRDAVIEAQKGIADAKPSDEPEVFEELQEALTDAKSEFGDEETKELAELEELESEVPEWYDGNTLIAEDYFKDYCKELCEEIGDVPKDIPDYIAIDWEQTAENLKVDYSEIRYQGENYYYRNC